MKKILKKIGLFFTKIGIMVRTESPRFFRNLFKFFLVLVGLATAGYPLLVQLVDSLTIYKIVAPAWLTTCINYVGAFAAGGAIVSQLVVKYEQLSTDEKKILDKT